MSLLEREILKPSEVGPVLVDFWAPWCAPCRLLGPILEKLERDSKGAWKLVKVDVDEHPDVSRQFQVKGIPAVKLFQNREVLAEFSGALPESQVRSWLEKSIPREITRALIATKEALAQNLRPEALLLARRAFKLEDTNTEARALLASLTLFEGPEAAAKLVATVEEGQPGYELAESVRTLALLWDLEAAPTEGPLAAAAASYHEGATAFREQHFDQALEAWITSMKQSRKLDEDGARRACVATFRLLGEEHPVTLAHRRAFASALY